MGEVEVMMHPVQSLVAVLALVASAALPGAAFAQTTAPAPQSNMGAPSNVGNLGSDYSFLNLLQLDNAEQAETLYRNVRTFSGCMVRLNSERTASILETGPFTREEARLVRRVVSRSSGCIGFRTAAPMPLLRGAISEALLESSSVIERNPLVTPAQYQAYVEFRAAHEATVPEAMQTTYKLAGCMTVRQPLPALALIRAEPGSAEEAANLAAFFEAAANCGLAAPPEELSVTLFRAYVAEALYDLTLVHRADQS